ncbi:2082_t:CDS:2 [Paraglomus brasilianum]|uniref:2082_t:CDS:1 n=1 Tax=Paraglomus brasilianum TaxID=144538 RepID=A0A9N8W4E7_9GLOM|nr:2082_t:CDS:2 [Paraglomus brasilianum]
MTIPTLMGLIHYKKGFSWSAVFVSFPWNINHTSIEHERRPTDKYRNPGTKKGTVGDLLITNRRKHHFAHEEVGIDSPIRQAKPAPLHKGCVRAVFQDNDDEKKQLVKRRRRNSATGNERSCLTTLTEDEMPCRLSSTLATASTYQVYGAGQFVIVATQAYERKDDDFSIKEMIDIIVKEKPSKMKKVTSNAANDVLTKYMEPTKQDEDGDGLRTY